VLTALRERGHAHRAAVEHPLAPRAARALAGRRGLLDLLDARLYTSGMTHMKPHAQAFRALLDAVGVEPSAAVFVGDRLRDDVSGAQAVGMRTVHLVGRPVEGFDVVPDAELVTLDGLVELVDGWRDERGSSRRPSRSRGEHVLVRGEPRCSRRRAELVDAHQRDADEHQGTAGQLHGAEGLPEQHPGEDDGEQDLGEPDEGGDLRPEQPRAGDAGDVGDDAATSARPSTGTSQLTCVSSSVTSVRGAASGRTPAGPASARTVPPTARPPQATTSGGRASSLSADSTK
jgi:hypothetical protein